MCHKNQMVRIFLRLFVKIFKFVRIWRSNRQSLHVECNIHIADCGTLTECIFTFIGITKTIKKKQKRVRTAFSTEQIRTLERTYLRHRYIDSERRAELAKTLNIGDKCIKIWFQNRRMKEKRESSESSYESSSETGNDTPTVPSSPPSQPSEAASPPLQVNNDQQSEPSNQCYYNTEQMYQLPTYYNQGQYFCRDNNIYQTQYYPYEFNYSNGEGNFNQFGNDVNNCWSSNYYPYYTPI